MCRYKALAHKTKAPPLPGIVFQRRATRTLLDVSGRRFWWFHRTAEPQTGRIIERAAIFVRHDSTLSHAANGKAALACYIELASAMCEQKKEPMAPTQEI